MNIFETLISILLLSCLCSAETVRTVPALMASFNLIPGLKPSLSHNEQLPFSENEANIYLTRSIEQCLSDAYIFVKIPGLQVSDFSNFTIWNNLRDRLIQASTILSMPNVIENSDSNSPIHWDSLQEVLENECRVVEYNVNDMNYEEIPKIIHTDKVLIEIDVFADLVYEKDTSIREEFLGEIDELIRAVCKKLPTRKVSVILGGLTTNETELDEIQDVDVIEFGDIPDDPKALSVSLREKVKDSKSFIFPDLTIFDKTRYFEFERNKNDERKKLSDLKEKQWAKDAEKNPNVEQEDDTWLEKKQKVIIKDAKLYKFGENEDFKSAFDNRQFVVDNSLIVVCSVLSLIGIVFFDFVKFLLQKIKNLFQKPVTKKKPE